MPILYYFSTYYFVRSYGSWKFFRSKLTHYWIDCLFILFNLVWIDAVNINFTNLVIIIIISVIGNFFLHKDFLRSHMEKVVEKYLFNYKTGRYSFAGLSHLVFSIIQTILILSFLLFSIKSYSMLIGSICLLLYFGSFIFNHKKLHRDKFIVTDMVISFFGFFVVILRMIVLL